MKKISERIEQMDEYIKRSIETVSSVSVPISNLQVPKPNVTFRDPNVAISSASIENEVLSATNSNRSVSNQRFSVPYQSFSVPNQSWSVPNVTFQDPNEVYSEHPVYSKSTRYSNSFTPTNDADNTQSRTYQLINDSLTGNDRILEIYNRSGKSLRVFACNLLQAFFTERELSAPNTNVFGQPSKGYRGEKLLALNPHKIDQIRKTVTSFVNGGFEEKRIVWASCKDSMNKKMGEIRKKHQLNLANEIILNNDLLN